MTETIDEQAGPNSWKLKIAAGGDRVRVSILGLKDVEKAYVIIPAKALQLLGYEDNFLDNRIGKHGNSLQPTISILDPYIS